MTRLRQPVAAPAGQTAVEEALVTAPGERDRGMTFV